MVNKILIAYSSKPSIGKYLASSFSKKGIQCRIVLADENHWFDRYIIHTVNKQLHNFGILPKNKNLFSNHPLAHKNFRSKNLITAFDKFGPDAVLLIRGIDFSTNTLEYISGKKAMLGWWVEKEERVRKSLAKIDFFSHYFFINSSPVLSAQEKGYSNVSLLHHSVDTNEFFKLFGATKRFDICFVGNWSKKRQEVLEALLRLTDNIALYGRKWLKKNILKPKVLKCIKGGYIEGKELNELYNKSKIVLNVTNWGFGEGDKQSGMNMRVLEVPATGSFLLTDGSKDLEGVIKPDVHLAVYKNLQECIEKAKYYLKNEEEREHIAKGGDEFTTRHYSYDNTADDILRVLA